VHTGEPNVSFGPSGCDQVPMAHAVGRCRHGRRTPLTGRGCTPMPTARCTWPRCTRPGTAAGSGCRAQFG